MHKARFYILLLFSAILISSCERKAGDEFQKVANEFTSAWNNHDLQALANLWTEDGNLITPWAHEYNGKEEIEKHLAKEHSENMKDSHMILLVQNVHFFDPDTAFVDADMTIEGMTVGGEKASPFHDYSIFVFVKRDGKWKILIARPY